MLRIAPRLHQHIMFTPLDWAGCRYQRLGHWPRGPFKDGMSATVLKSGRLLSWGLCTCRLPVLILWTLFVILFLYKSISTSLPRTESVQLLNHESQQALKWTAVTSREDDAAARRITELQETTTLEMATSISMNQPVHHFSEHARNETIEPDRVNGWTDSATGEKSPILLTTRKSPVSEYARQSEILIVIIQDSDVKSKTQRSSRTEASLNLYPADHARGGSSSSKGFNDEHKLKIPQHISQLTEILESHRIGFAIDTTRYGMPNQLLDAQRPKKYSVIVIDDFVKYMRLNRWLRDQLDRHCRTNQIGVISYLIDSTSMRQPLDLDSSHEQLQQHEEQEEEGRVRRHFPSGSTVAPSNSQFPLAFEPIRVDCRNGSSAACLVNYQLNDKTKILRILKPKQNFVIAGQLDSSSVVAMSSNHLTYEPLTWAQLRTSESATEPRHKRIAVTGRSESARAVTRPAHHVDRPSANVAHVQKRAVLPKFTSADSGTAEHSRVMVIEARMDGLYDDRKAGAADADADAFDPDIQSSSRGDEAPSQAPDDQSFHSAVNAPGGTRKILSMLDHGLYDDIRRVIFGVSNQQWLDRVLLLDVIEHLSSGEIMTPLDRYIQIDIDDIFVGSAGTRLQRDDVDALIETQNEFERIFEDGFQFQLGFSGKYFKHGNEAEQLGDEYLIQNADKFSWFCHFWSHSKAHLFNDTTALELELRRNLEFAQSKKLVLVGHSEPMGAADSSERPMLPTYAVAPHHSGVYPVHEQLYDAWRSVLNVQVTSTEEYPHLRPATRRRGFVHKAIKVLPRQTCGLYTHTIFRDKYPGGFGKLLASVRGGELFQTVLHNPINIYMTHMSNYANDRLAPQAFRELFAFIGVNTNLRLRFARDSRRAHQGRGRHRRRRRQDLSGAPAGGPLFLADYYFSLQPREREPLWTNPCDDKRHLAIWSADKQRLCRVAPQVLIVGPQKTGTTALHTFLLLNPAVRTSKPSARDFEEVQFFNDKHYGRGSHWYFERFLADAGADIDASANATQSQGELSLMPAPVYLDKSATYFDDPKVPRRASALLPGARVVILLIDPADRAHSWYQHVRAHGTDEIANELSFDEVIMFQDDQGDQPNQAHGTNSQELGARGASSRAPTIRGKPLTGAQVAAIRLLRARCLQPGYYASHLLRWLDHFPPRQIVIIDGEWFKFNPAAVLNRLQLLLRLPQQVDYAKLLVYSTSKGFFCERAQTAAHHHRQQQQTGAKCLGSGKGRRYAPMSEAARKFLNAHYWPHNRQLAQLLYEIGQPLPTWLDESINSLPAGSRKHKRRR